MTAQPEPDVVLGLYFHAEAEVIKGPGEDVPILGQDDKE